MVLKHVPDIQFFECDHSKTAYQFPAQLMGKVLATIGNPLTDMLNRLAPLCSFGRSFFSPREKVLHLRQFFLILTKEAGIFNLHPIGERGKTFKSHVHPDCHFIEWQGFGFHFTGQAGIPVANRIPLNSECLDPALDGTPILEMSRPLPAGSQSKPDCLKVSLDYRPYSPKTRVAWLFACLHSTKETLESQIHSLLNVLQDLGMDTHQFGMFSFPKSEPLIRVVQRKGFLFLLPGIFASGQRLIEYPTTKFQRPIELGALAPGRLEAILEGSHRTAHVFCLPTMSYFLQGSAPCNPREIRGFGAVSVNTRTEIETYIAENAYVNP
jgi:hypothetical protein